MRRASRSLWLGLAALLLTSTGWAASGGPDTFGYTYLDSNEPGGPTYDFVDIQSSGTSLTLGDDQSISISLPFNFNYYGVDYSSLWVSSNGFLSFTSSDQGCCTGQALPSTSSPTGVIAAWWEDLHPGQGAGVGAPGNPGYGHNIHYQVMGSAPNRVLIVQFTGVPYYSSGGSNTFEFKLFESTNIIQIHYQALSGDGGTYSMGIDNPAGTDGLQYYLGSGSAGAASFTFPFAVEYTTGHVIADYDFSTGAQGWTSGITPGANPSAVNGWQLTTQTGGTSPVIFPNTAYGTANDGDQLGLEQSYLMSPVLDLTGAVRVTFDTFVANETGNYDREYVEISYDGGTTWHPLIDYTDPVWTLQDTWHTVTAVIPAGMGTANSYLRFRYDTVDGCCGPTDIVGWFVDNIRVYAQNGIALSGSVLNAAQGTTVTHHLSLSNYTSGDLTFTLSAVPGHLWGASYPGSVTVPAGQFKNIAVNVMIPAFGLLSTNVDTLTLRADAPGYSTTADIVTHTETVQLTDGPNNRFSDVPRISADGSKIVFYSNADLTGQNSDGSYEIYIINADGTGLRQLTDSSSTAYTSYGPDLNADGSVVVFYSTADLTGGNPDHSYEVFTINADGTNLRQLTASSYQSYGARIAADTDDIVFLSYGNLTGQNAGLHSQVFSMHADGTGLRQLTSSNYDANTAAISDDGQRIVYTSTQDLGSGSGAGVPGSGTGYVQPPVAPVGASNPDHSIEVFVVNADGSGNRQLSPGGTSYSDLAEISGNGEVIAYESGNDYGGAYGFDNPDLSSEIFTVNFDGTGTTQLTHSNRASYAPSLSFDGNIVSFRSYGDLLGDGSNADASAEVFVIDRQAQQLLQLTQSAQNSYGGAISNDGMSVTYYSYADLVSRNPDNSLEIYLSYLNGRPSSDTTFLKGNLVVTALPNITIPGLDERKVKYALEQDASAQQNTQTTKTKVGAMDPWLLSIGLAGLGLRRRRRRAPRGGSAQP